MTPDEREHDQEPACDAEIGRGLAAANSACVRCSCDLNGLDEAPNCPECGLPITDSLRPGSPWQQRPGVRSWLQTAWQLMVGPTAVLRRVSAARRPRTILMNTLLAVFQMGACLVWSTVDLTAAGVVLWLGLFPTVTLALLSAITMRLRSGRLSSTESKRARAQRFGHVLVGVGICVSTSSLVLLLAAVIANTVHFVTPMPNGIGMSNMTSTAIFLGVSATITTLVVGSVWTLRLAWVAGGVSRACPASR